VGDGVDHLLLVGLPGEGVLAVFGLDLGLGVLVAALLPLLVLYGEDVGVLAVALPPVILGHHALGSAEGTQRLLSLFVTDERAYLLD
jgi:hypothetical protein